MNDTTWSTVVAGAGRNDRPALLNEYFDDLPEHEKPFALSSTWTLAEHPLNHLDGHDWTSMFTHVGFIVDGTPTPRTSYFAGQTHVRVYRGCTTNSVAGMSWTTSESIAQWFADRHPDGEGIVVHMLAPVEYVLAVITERGEDELVIEIGALLDDDQTTISMS